jgi:hypothetical protein
MKLISALACAAAACCLSCGAQTNLCADKAVAFFIPQVQLRPQATSEAAKPEQSISPKPISTAPVQMTTVDIVFGDDDLHSRVVRSDQFYLTRSEPRSDNPMVRVVDGIFTPEVVHIGKIPITCSVITAIKRKNPLCLLNPVVFQASW